MITFISGITRLFLLLVLYQMRLVIAAFATVAVMSGAAIADAPTLVQIETGKAQGAAGDGVIAFKGVPYAQPPFGALRWRAPQPVAPWQGVLASPKSRTDCVQLPAIGTSEDCLYLNVWQPVAAGDKPLPVMVWIPGGGLIRGGASLYPFDNFARQGIVVVSLSYRLGRFGFFAHPALAVERPDEPRGNYGYMDQIAALKWVQRNIAASAATRTM
jgi:para-nitrobenzyl esterase